MEFENLTRAKKPVTKKINISKNLEKTSSIFTNLLEIENKLSDLTKELANLGKAGIQTGDLLFKLEVITKLVEESKSKLKQGGPKNAQKNS